MSVVIANTTQAYEAGPLSAHVWAPGPPAPCLASRTLSMSLCGVPAQEPTVRAHLARSWEGAQRSGPGQAPPSPALPAAGGASALSSSSWDKNYHMNVDSSRSWAGGAGEGTRSHPQRPPGSQMAAARQRKGRHSQYRGGSLWRWVGVCLWAGQGMLGPSKCGRAQGLACALNSVSLVGSLCKNL